MAAVSQWAHDNGVKVHVDGARLFNAVVSKGYSVREFSSHADTVSLCFSKGLGCPMGSILVGDAETIYRARRARKVFGGALRQAGMMAAAAIYALEHHIDRMKEDHDNARAFAALIAKIDGVRLNLSDVESNLVFFEIDPELGTAEQLSVALLKRGVKINSSGPHRLRACTHLDVTLENVVHAAQIVRESITDGFADVQSTVKSAYASR
jgi:threonine aldolase